MKITQSAISTSSLRLVFSAILITIFLYLTPYGITSLSAGKRSEALCQNLFATWGNEWELADSSFAPDWAERLTKGNFRKLYAFYGKDTNGLWIRNYIPENIVRSNFFEKLLLEDARTYNSAIFANLISELPSVPTIKDITALKELSEKKKILFENHGGKLFLRNWETLEQDALIHVMAGLMAARGEKGKDLKIRKIPAAWRDKTSKYDHLIPEVASEEWWGGEFGGLEFSMAGYVKKKSELRAYLKHLFLRLGFFTQNNPKLKNALDSASVHTHWLPAIHRLPKGQRETVYQATIGFWGDSNDAAIVDHFNHFKEIPLKKGQISLREKPVADIWESFLETTAQTAILPLVRSTFERVSVADNGILVRNRSKNIDPDVDPNFPPVFKLLHFGLRGAYGQKTLPEGAPIPLTGIEARNEPGFQASVNSLPVTTKKSNLVSLQSLLKHASKKKRGLSDSTNSLKFRAKILGIDPALVDELNSALADEKNSAWHPARLRAVFLIPLNDWLNHPVVMRNLKAMNPLKKVSAIQQYKQALARYRFRIQDLTQARKNIKRHYKPDWTEDVSNLPEGFNRVFPEISLSGKTTKEANQWFQIILISEASRFIAESGLSDLLKSH